jgi:hypothetical protein
VEVEVPFHNGAYGALSLVAEAPCQSPYWQGVPEFSLFHMGRKGEEVVPLEEEVEFSDWMELSSHTQTLEDQTLQLPCHYCPSHSHGALQGVDGPEHIQCLQVLASM